MATGAVLTAPMPHAHTHRRRSPSLHVRSWRPHATRACPGWSTFKVSGHRSTGVAITLHSLVNSIACLAPHLPTPACPVARCCASKPAQHHARTLLPLYLVIGGPGFEAPRMSEVSIWVRPAISSHRLLLLDQRGTGRSTPITTTNLPLRGGPEEQAEYLSYFR